MVIKLDESLMTLPGEDKYSALRDVVMSSPAFSAIDRNRLLSAVIEREEEQSTYIGHGVSIAHGKIDGLKKTLIALGISDKGLSGDREPIHILFAIASSPDNPGGYLKAVSSILTWVHMKEFREKLQRHDLSDPVVRIFLSMLKRQDFLDYFKALESRLKAHREGTPGL